MMRQMLPCALWALALMGTATAQNRPDAAAVLERDADRLAAMWDGWYDNANQVNFQERFNLPEEGWESRRLKIFKRVRLPAFGDTVTYVEQYLGEPPTALYRQRIYRHWADHDNGDVVTDIYSFRNEEGAARAAGAHLDPTRLASLTPEQMDMVPRGCEVRWRRMGDQFVGVQIAETCLYVPAGMSDKVRVADTIRLTADVMTTETRITREDGVLIAGNTLGLPQVSRKARLFNCHVLALNPGVAGNVERHEGYVTYDQGGEFSVTTAHEPPKELTVRLLNIVPPAGSSRNTLIMSLAEENELFPTAMAFVAPDAPRAAISIAGVEANCTVAAGS